MRAQRFVLGVAIHYYCPGLPHPAAKLAPLAFKRGARTRQVNKSGEWETIEKELVTPAANQVRIKNVRIISSFFYKG